MRTVLLCAIFFASGVSALIFETLWFRQAGLALGNTMWTASLVLSGFMGGLALGNALAARYGGRLKNPVGGYAIAEAAIALSGVGLVYLFPLLGTALARGLYPLLDHPWILNSLHLVVAFLLLLVPSTAMGVTLPVLTKALTAFDPNFGRVLGRLYGWNTLGAVGGTVLGEMWLIRVFGIHGTALTAGALNLAAAGLAAWIATQWTDRPALVPDRAARYAVSGSVGGRWLAAVFVSGFCLLALEVVWFRFLLLFVMGHSVAFALMLCVVLAGIALGGLAGSQWLRRVPDAHRFASPVAFCTGLLCVVCYAAFTLVEKPFETATITRVMDILYVGTPLMFPVSFLSGGFFTLVGAALRNSLASETGTAGVLTLSNTTGAALGSVVSGFVFLPILGMEKSLFVIALLYGGIGLFLWLGSPVPRRIAYASAAGFLLSLTLFPFGSMQTWFREVLTESGISRDAEARISGVREGLTETLIYFEPLLLGRPLYETMFTNSVTQAGTSYQPRRLMKLYVYWPMAVHPDLKRSLLIGYGIGNTAKAMTDSKSLETIDVVDTSRDVLEMNDIVYPEKAQQPLRDPRVRVHIGDGRFYLKLTQQRFDLITGMPLPPGVAGVENLYTREYFELLHDRLAEGGIVTYGLVLRGMSDVGAKAILRAFCDVFEDCSLWNGMGNHFMMVGTRNARGPVSEEQFIRQWRDPVVAAEMRRLGFERPEQLGALFIGDAEYLKELIGTTPPLVDNDPKLIEAPFSSQEAANRFLSSITDTVSARERFRRSALIRRLWPERLLAESLPYFEFQDMINSYLRSYGSNRANRDRGIENAYRLLTRSSLNTPVLWFLGGDSDVDRVLFMLTPEELAYPTMQFFLATRFVSQRNYAAAVDAFIRAEQQPQLREDAFLRRIFALCLEGQTAEAQRLEQERIAPFLVEKGQDVASLPPIWLWLNKTFGIDPLAGARTQRSRSAASHLPG